MRKRKTSSQKKRNNPCCITFLHKVWGEEVYWICPCGYLGAKTVFFCSRVKFWKWGIIFRLLKQSETNIVSLGGESEQQAPSCSCFSTQEDGSSSLFSGRHTSGFFTLCPQEASLSSFYSLPELGIAYESRVTGWWNRVPVAESWSSFPLFFHSPSALHKAFRDYE